MLDTDTSAYALPPTLIARSGRGRHAYFCLPPDLNVRNRIGLLPGLDLRATGGMIIAPPSRHASGVTYSWEAEKLLLLPPTWLVALLAPPRAVREATAALPPSASHHARQQRDGNSTIRYGRAYAAHALEGELASLRAAVPGTRNRTLNWVAFLAGQFIAAGYVDETTTTRALMDAGLEVGLAPAEVAKTIRSGVEAGQRAV